MAQPITKLAGLGLAAWLFAHALQTLAVADMEHQDTVRANAQATATAKGAVPASRTL